MEIISLVFSVLFCIFTTVAEPCSEGSVCKEISCVSCDNERIKSDINWKICPTGSLLCHLQQTNICIKCTQWHALNNSECLTCPPGCKSCEQNLEELCSKSHSYITTCSGKLVDNATEQYLVHCKLDASSLICTSCKSGFYGETCERHCSHGCLNSTCYRQNGKCLSGCRHGFDGDFCGGCVVGKYGRNCFNNCSRTCKRMLCYQITGYCIDGCQDSKFGKKCEDNCLQNCEKCYSDTSCQTCSEGYAGYFCNDTCPEGCRGDCYRDGTCIDCKDGYYDLRNENVRLAYTCNATCPENCFRGLCNRTGSCYSCSNGFYGDRCEQSCSSDCCNGTCLQNGSCELCRDANNTAGEQWDAERIGLVSLIFFLAMIVCLFIVVTVIQRRRRVNEIRTFRVVFPVTMNAVWSVYRNSHVYSNPYECPLQASGQDGDAVEQHIYSAL